MTCVFTEVVVPTSASRDIASLRSRTLGWAHLDANRGDLVEIALASDMQRTALAHVAES